MRLRGVGDEVRTAPARIGARGPLVLAIVLGLAAVAGREAGARGAPPKPRPRPPREEPRGTTIRDGPTTLSVPLDAERSLVIGLPERFWLQCPRNLPVPTSLDGDGVIAQYMNARGGSWSMLYVGVVPLAERREGEAPEARAGRTSSDFATGLPHKYRGVEWTVLSAPVVVEPSSVAVDGRRTRAWRTPRYTLRPMDYGGPESTFVGECVLFQPEGVDRLVYVALDAKSGGTTLDAVIDQLSVKSARAVNPTGRRVQLNDLALSADPTRYPVRQIAFDLPKGFLLTRAAMTLPGEWVWVEERLGAGGRVDAVLRVSQSLSDPSRTLEEDLEIERTSWTAADRGPAIPVSLAVPGQRAWVYSHALLRDGVPARGHTAVLRVDDLTLVVTWISLGDAVQSARDRGSLMVLLRSLDFAVRW